MALCTLRDLLPRARREGYAVGAFSVANMEMVAAIVEAAESLDAPVILQLAQGRLNGSPLHLMAPMMLSAARSARVPVAVHLDHGSTLPVIRQALDWGFTSVMYDGSSLPLEENIENTLRVMEMAKKTGASVEAELGSIGRTEEGGEAPVCIARAEDCTAFLKAAPVDALAVAIGNSHGLYAAAPQLHFEVIEALKKETNTPFVFHGGTGISQEEFRRMGPMGISKVNIATSSFICAAQAYERSHAGIYEKMRCVRDALCENARAHILWFGSDGKAEKGRETQDAV